jgi:hypothetical protein
MTFLPLPSTFSVVIDSPTFAPMFRIGQIPFAQPSRVEHCMAVKSAVMPAQVISDTA